MGYQRPATKVVPTVTLPKAEYPKPYEITVKIT